MVKKLKWCDFCRETDVDLGCAGDDCNRSFHKDCIRLSGESWQTDEVTKEISYHCQNCAADLDAEEDRDFHDDRCSLCKKKEKADVDGMEFTRCSACPKSHHLKCLGLQRLPEIDNWQCPTCSPEINTVQVRLKGINRQKIGNVQICYVCQQGGRLLGCAQCPQSYHPKCIDAELLKDMTDDWVCPLCLGIDPLRHMRHRRMDINERREMSKRRQAHISKIRAATRINRDAFLFAQRSCIKPFISDKTMNRLRAAAKKVRTIKAAAYHSIDVKIYDQLEAKLAEGDLGFKTILNEGVKLKPYQVYGVCWMLHAFEHKAGVILADEMGLGKTIQTLAFLSTLRAKGIEGPHLVVVPLSTVGNWVREIQKFTSHLTYTKICGSRSERIHAMEEPVAAEGCVDVYITTYETVATEEWFFADKFRWATIILDEAHRIKSEKGAVRHSLDRIETSFRVLLTGTPLQNNVKELHTLLNFLFPDILTSGDEFEKAFMTGTQSAAAQNQIRPTQKGKGKIEAKIAKANLETTLDIDEERMAAVCQLLQLLMLRRTKIEVVDLPPKMAHEIWLPMTQLQLKLYRGLLDMSEIDISEGKVKKMLGTMIKMRLACSHPTSAIRGHEVKPAEPVDNPHKIKLRVAHEYAMPLEGHNPMLLPHEEFTKSLDEIDGLVGEEHIKASSKLHFVDKLLCTLHRQNMDHSSLYREQYLRYTREHGSLGVVKPTDEELAQDPHHPMFNQVSKEDQLLFENDIVPYVFDEDTGTKHWETAEEYKRDYEHSIKEKRRQSTPKRIINVESSNSIDEDGSAGGASTSDNEIDEAFVSPVVGKSAATKKVPQVHKMLIFSQFRLVLTELEMYLKYRGFRYMRLDGATNKMIRELDIREFNDDTSTHLVYLIGTRAGGMGINLVTANHVMLFDEDWNPFVDIQAIDRAHRIGQNRRVHVWKLTSEWSVEERMAFRRAQKMKLDSKLIRARTEEAEAKLANDQEQHEKLGVDDVRKLLVYGAEAIRWLDLCNTPNSIENVSLSRHLERTRRHMPEDIEKQLMAEVEVDAAQDDEDEENGDRVEVNTDDDDDDAKTITSMSGEAAASNTLEMLPTPVEEHQNDDLNEDGTVKRRRGTRIRKPTQLIYQPAPLEKEKKARLPTRHEDKCFICQDKEFKKTVTVRADDKNIDTTEDNLDEGAALIRCNICPKVYHVGGCLGLPVEMKERKNYRCQWHECSICYRKSSQAGGLLIHCAACPTSFCFDCFPPEYRRYWPDPMYYENLCARGFNTNGDNFITYLCSRCKAMEQQKRRSMLDAESLKAELNDEKNEQQRHRDEEKRIKEEARLERESKAKWKNEEKEKKRLMREEKEAERRSINEEKLRRANEVLRHRDLANELITTIDGLFPENGAELFTNMLQLVNWAPGKGPLTKTVDARVRQDLTNGFKDVVKTCTNCFMPLHKARECPWPPEIRKVSHYLSLDKVLIDDRGIPSVPEGTPGMNLFETSEWTIRRADNVIEIDAIAPEPIPEHLSKDIYKKKMTRGYCSRCGVNAREHSRRQCPELTDVEKEAYNRHKHDLGALIINLSLYEGQFKQRLPSPPDMSELSLLTEDDHNVPVKLDPRFLRLGDTATRLMKWRNEIVDMVADYLSLVSNAIQLNHINCTNPEFTPFPDPIFDFIKSISRSEKQAQYSRGKKRTKADDSAIINSNGAEELTAGTEGFKKARVEGQEGWGTPRQMNDSSVEYSGAVDLTTPNEINLVTPGLETPPVSNKEDLESACGPDTSEHLFGSKL